MCYSSRSRGVQYYGVLFKSVTGGEYNIYGQCYSSRWRVVYYYEECYSSRSRGVQYCGECYSSRSWGARGYMESVYIDVGRGGYSENVIQVGRGGRGGIWRVFILMSVAEGIQRMLFKSVVGGVGVYGECLY